jgi:glucose-6-phosphate dehydrogenase assembly protein OpcA
MRDMAALVGSTRLAISDFALIRQSRWREAIASTFDDPDFMPYLHSIRRIAVTYGTHDETETPGSTNLVKPIYHVGWLASRLGLSVVRPLAPVRPTIGAGLAATLADGRSEVAVVVRPVRSPMPSGTTLRVELLAERRGSELRTDVTAEAETVHVQVWQDGVEVVDRRFRSARRTDVDLLAEVIESGRRDPVAVGSLRAAAALIEAEP